MLRGDRVKHRRLQLGLTQEELATRANTDQRRISKYENEQSGASGEKLGDLARALETTTDYLLGLVDDPKGTLQESDLTPEEREILSAIRAGVWDDVLELVSKEMRSERPRKAGIKRLQETT